MAMYEESGKLYKAKKYAEAASLLRQAYALEPAPVLQYNLARCLERLGDSEGALAAYELYLKDSDESAPHRAAVDARVAMLRRAVAENRGAADEQKKEAAPVPMEQEERPPAVAGTAPAPLMGTQVDHEVPGIVEPSAKKQDDEGITFMDVTPWAVAGLGVAVAAVGVVLGMSAASKADDANDPGISMTEAVKQHDDAESLAGTATILLIAGGVVAAGGITWGVIHVLGDGDKPDDTTADLHLTPNGLLLSGQF